MVSEGLLEWAQLFSQFDALYQAFDEEGLLEAMRWLVAHAERYSTGNDTLLGDDFYAHQPFCRQVLLHGFHFLFTCKPTSHRHLSGWVEGLDPGAPHLEAARQRQIQPLGTPPLSLGQRGAVDGQCGRLKSQLVRTDHHRRGGGGALSQQLHHRPGDHRLGHGKQHLASLLMTMNLLAFGFHTLLELADQSYRLIRAMVGARRRFFQHLEALTRYLHFESWERLMNFMMQGLEIGPYAVPKS